MNTRFGFLLFNDFEDLDFFGPWEIIAQWSKNYNGPEIVTISETEDKVQSVLGLTLSADFSFKNCPKLDYLLVPGGQGTRSEVNNKQLISFITQKAQECKNILSVCTGAFLLQAAGLLHNKKATTHWASMDRLRAFKEVTVVEDRYVNDGNIWTSAGVSAGMDLSFAFIESVTSKKTADEIRHYIEY